MFWGLEMEPAKVYRQKVDKSFHVSMACLQPNKCTDTNYTSLILRKDDHDFVLCNLQKDKMIQVQLDLMFGSGDEITFTLTGGKNKIYLSGYVCEEDDDDLFQESDSEVENAMEEEIPTLVEGKRKNESSPFESKSKKAKLKTVQSDDDSSDESYEEGNENVGDEEDSDEEDSDEEDESGSESDDELDSEEENAQTAKTPEKSKNQSPVMKQLSIKKQQNTPVSTPTTQVNGTTPKSKKKNKANTPGGDESAATPKSQKSPQTPKESTPQKTKLEGGVVAIDTKVGSGAYAKAGKRVAVYYTGRLQQNNKQFDSSLQGKGFVFQLGRGEVIKGWDIGVAGMKVGGKRKIIVPAPLAYGSKGSPPVIPPNANLVFEVELKNVY